MDPNTRKRGYINYPEQIKGYGNQDIPLPTCQGPC